MNLEYVANKLSIRDLAFTVVEKIDQTFTRPFYRETITLVLPKSMTSTIIFPTSFATTFP